MSVQEFAAQLRDEMRILQEQGTAAIYCENLINYLQGVVDSPPGTPDSARLAQLQAQLQHQIELSKSQHESNLEMFRSVISAGQNAIRSSFLLNGGTAVALLAFIGHLATSKPEMVATFAGVLHPFAFGVLAITVTSGFTYLSQWLYASEKQAAQRIGFGLNLLTIGLGLSSYGASLWGMKEAANAFAAFA